ncbi:MAG: response regulator [Magnetococcales bacterium]|nr:response regulator [Magnetococcales bacterium]
MDLEARILQAKILIIDDQRVNVKLLEKLLIRSGYTSVYATTDPQEGVGIYTQEQIDLVLLDIRMPVMDGFQVMVRLKEIEGNGGFAPILVLTAQTDRETRMRALSEGARDFITKPFDQAEVLSRIRNLVEVRILHREVQENNQRLEKAVQERTNALQRIRMDLIRRLGHAAEFRDNDTGLHILRVSHYAKCIACSMGLNESRCQRLFLATPMHDVGKLAIPDNVLLKPAKLNNDEWVVMQDHATIGATILSGDDYDYPLLEMARTIAQTHHERWDGTGYPDGLKGEDIPLEGRIVAVADVFDALISERPYKQAWTTDLAVEEIQQMSETHFDPEVVKHFLICLPEIMKVLNAFSESDGSAESSEIGLVENG